MPGPMLDELTYHGCCPTGLAPTPAPTVKSVTASVVLMGFEGDLERFPDALASALGLPGISPKDISVLGEEVVDWTTTTPVKPNVKVVFDVDVTGALSGLGFSSEAEASEAVALALDRAVRLGLLAQALNAEGSGMSVVEVTQPNVTPRPSRTPSASPSAGPTLEPTAATSPTVAPSPTSSPSLSPTLEPSSSPTVQMVVATIVLDGLGPSLHNDDVRSAFAAAVAEAMALPGIAADDVDVVDWTPPDFVAANGGVTTVVLAIDVDGAGYTSRAAAEAAVQDALERAVVDTDDGQTSLWDALNDRDIEVASNVAIVSAINPSAPPTERPTRPSPLPSQSPTLSVFGLSVTVAGTFDPSLDDSGVRYRFATAVSTILEVIPGFEREFIEVTEWSDDLDSTDVDLRVDVSTLEGFNEVAQFVPLIRAIVDAAVESGELLRLLNGERGIDLESVGASVTNFPTSAPSPPTSAPPSAFPSANPTLSPTLSFVDVDINFAGLEANLADAGVRARFEAALTLMLRAWVGPSVDRTESTVQVVSWTPGPERAVAVTIDCSAWPHHNRGPDEAQAYVRGLFDASIADGTLQLLLGGQEGIELTSNAVAVAVTSAPTREPTPPSFGPSMSPSVATKAPTAAASPTLAPTRPSVLPTVSPSQSPSSNPSPKPSSSPSARPWCIPYSVKGSVDHRTIGSITGRAGDIVAVVCRPGHGGGMAGVEQRTTCRLDGSWSPRVTCEEDKASFFWIVVSNKARFEERFFLKSNMARAYGDCFSWVCAAVGPSVRRAQVCVLRGVGVGSFADDKCQCVCSLVSKSAVSGMHAARRPRGSHRAIRWRRRRHRDTSGQGDHRVVLPPHGHHRLASRVRVGAHVGGRHEALRGARAAAVQRRRARERRHGAGRRPVRVRPDVHLDLLFLRARWLPRNCRRRPRQIRGLRFVDDENDDDAQTCRVCVNIPNHELGVGRDGKK